MSAKRMKQAIFIIIIAILLVTLTLVNFLRHTPVANTIVSKTTTSEGVVATITLHENGFSPSRTVVKKNDTVKFITSRKQNFWPASDLHPTHELYPEFDPRRPVRMNEAWLVTFTRTGTWRYHDHLSPNYRGILVVE